MLEKVDLSKKLDKDEYKKIISGLELKLGDIQRQARDLKIPVAVVFEGWDASGKGTLINELMLTLDPRGFNVYSIHEPGEEEKLRPFLWRFWTKTPAKGRIAIFDRSWYSEVLSDRVDKEIGTHKYEQVYHDILAFERQLADDGVVMVKFFLHISKKEQKKRFEELQENDAMSWRVTGEDKKHHKQYEEYLNEYERMFQETDTAYAPWTIVEAHERRFATVKVFTTFIHALEEKVNQLKNSLTGKEKTERAKIKIHSTLDQIDLTKTLYEEEYVKKLEKYQKKIREIEYEMYSKRIPMMVLYEGWDAAGKGGNIKRLTHGLDPRGYEVIPVAAPNEAEKSHHYLWRFWNSIPKAGHITIFDRTWYGRVLVERIEGFCSKEEWKRAYREINETEEQLVNSGMVLVKFWLQIDKDEQLKRFQERQQDPNKQWKITEEDWRNREKWDLYKEAVDEMLFRTSTDYAPWTVIESNCKFSARLKALKTIIECAEKRL